MASNHIEIPNTPRLAGELRYTVDLGRQFAERIVKLYDIVRSFAYDYIALGAALGITTAEAETVAAKISTVYSELQDIENEPQTAINQLIDILG